MIRTRVTRIEAFRRVLLGWQDEAELIRDIEGRPVQPSWQMEAGTAFHRLLERPLDVSAALDEGPFVRIEENGWSIQASDVAEVREHQGPGLREVTAEMDFGGVQVSGTCDHVRGRVIRDTKCKFSPVDAKAYENSLQWRFYLVLHDCDCFAYDLLDFRTDLQRLDLMDIHTVRFWRYQGIERDCFDWAQRFGDWYRMRFREAA